MQRRPSRVVAGRDMVFGTEVNNQNPTGSRVAARTLIVDAGNNTLIAIGHHTPDMVALGDMLLNAVAVFGVRTDGIERLEVTPARELPEWSWDGRTRTFVRTHPPVLTDAMRERAYVAAKKKRAIADVRNLIGYLRARQTTGLPFESAAESARLKDAQTYLAKPDSAREEVPYLADYADVYGYPLQTAAEDIVTRAGLFDEILRVSERTRLQLMKKIRDAQTPESVEQIMLDYRRDGTL